MHGQFESCGPREIVRLSEDTAMMTPSSATPRFGRATMVSEKSDPKPEHTVLNRFFSGSGQRIFINSRLDRNLQGEGNGKFA